MDKKAIVLILFFVLILSACPLSASSDNYGQNQASLTKEEMLQEIKDKIEANPDILDSLPELKQQKDKDGKEAYVFSDGKKEIKLEDLDENKLKEIFKKVSTQTDVVQDKFQRQEIQTAEEAQRRPPKPPPRPPDIPPRR